MPSLPLQELAKLMLLRNGAQCVHVYVYACFCFLRMAAFPELVLLRDWAHATLCVGVCAWRFCLLQEEQQLSLSWSC